MNFFDTHAHFGLNPGASLAAIRRALADGVTRMTAVGGSRDLNAAAIAVKQEFPEHIELALGFDRSQAKDADTDVFIDTLNKLCSRVDLSAVGETGLDFHYEAGTAAAQCELFAAHLRLADELRRPVVIHTREANEATLRVLDQTPWYGEGLRGVVHCFTGDCDFAEQLMERRLAISFSGIVTFRNADQLRKSAAFVPDNRLLIETDSPYLTPVPKRGRENEPAFVVHVAECLARVRNTTVEHIAQITTANAEQLFCGQIR